MANNLDNPQNITKTSQNSKNSKAILIIPIVLVVAVAGLVIGLKTQVIPMSSWLSKMMPAPLLQALNLSVNLSGEEAKLALILQSGKSGECVIKEKTGATQITYQAKDGKYLMEAITTDQVETITSLSLFDGEYQYHWVKGEKQGTKFKMPSLEETQKMQKDAEELAKQYNFDADITNDYSIENDDSYYTNCQFKNISDATFVVPTDIEFLEIDDSFTFDYNDPNDSEDDINTTQDNTEYPVDELQMPDTSNQQELEQWAKEMEEQFNTP